MYASFLIIIGVLPSIIWLAFYLRKDKNPEPNSLVVLVFLAGAAMAVPIAIISSVFSELSVFIKNTFVSDLYIMFFTVAFIEELGKYLAVRWTILKDKEFNEPIDAMLYMIIAALGFAAAENILSILTLPQGSFEDAASIIILRFLGATFLHTLSSGIIGYYLALNIFNPQKTQKKIFPWQGMVIATIAHALYNYIVVIGDSFKSSDDILLLMVFFAAIYLLTFASIIFFSFKKIINLN